VVMVRLARIQQEEILVEVVVVVEQVHQVKQVEMEIHLQ